MEKVIWTIGDKRNEMIEAQRRINSIGSMRAFCMLSTEALEKTLLTLQENRSSRISSPSLIIIDYDMAAKEEFRVLSILKNQRYLAGVPVFFMTDKRTRELDEECYALGAMVVLHKPFSKSGILRIERIAWQYEVTKNYEKMLQEQAVDLQAAREIMRLNQKLESRNELLYQVFGRYFSDKVLEVILEHPEDVSIGGEKRELTVMMSDLRGFTSLSAELEPEAVTGLLNLFFSKMVEIISKYNGTVIELLGDCVLAVFGAPLPSKEQTADAVAAAIEMQNAMQDVNIYCEEQGYPKLEIGIGIHRGEAFIGNVGSKKMMRYNVVGSVVNECSRIEGYSVGGQVLVSMASLENISIPLKVNSIMEINAKGLSETIKLCEVLGIEGEYKVSIENVEDDVLADVDEAIQFLLYPVENKIVAGEPVVTELKRFSKKKAVVRVSGDDMLVFSDVEVTALALDGRIIFNDVYAKIIDRKDSDMTLHFTHINQKFRTYADMTINNR